MLTLADVIEAVRPGELTGSRPAEAGKVITEAVIDSRQVIPGSLFVALPGERVDGHDFVAQAFELGANYALVQRDVESLSFGAHAYPGIDLRSGATLPDPIPDPPLCLRVDDSLKALQQTARLWRRKLNLRVVAITGSVGKSTTKELVAEVLDQRYRTLKNPGNLNNEIGLPLSLLRLGKGHQAAVLEMGFYVLGEIAFLCDLAQPQVGVVTNIGTVHAERAGSREAIAQGKGELVEALPPAPEGIAILNRDDPLVREMAKRTQARVFYYGLDPEADLWADEIQGLGLEGVRFRLHYHNETMHLRVPLIGRHSVHTVLRAAAVGLVLGLTWEEIIRGLRFGHTQLRLVAVRTASGALLLDDTYNASPESTLAALNLLSELDGRKVAVLGDMYELGQYEQSGHEIVGKRAAEVVDELVTVGRLGKIIARSAARAGLSLDAICELPDTGKAIEYLRAHLGPEDVVLVKGSRGMRMEQITTALEHRLSDPADRPSPEGQL